ncbi:VacJ family lipoprotein [Novosphingobium umbonatum]|uniref:VacJ family lipoprotein n=1 Tax=Novosphingobium umbonatum TaxID=1908524 RepID=A0A3S2VDP7_9SPHN|nr:VacJ family lipoprotein [Novosphingobium umbonatum]RVU05449.1 VacJ family lipoprotein [Novosphingobium umbonatum]
MSAALLSPLLAVALAQAAPEQAAEPPPAPASPAPASESSPPAPRHDSDPLEGLNRISYAISQPFDRFLIRPVAIVYLNAVPEPLRDGARNAINNLFQPVGVFNDILQLRPRRALRTTARIVINTTLGIGGLFDIAKRKPFNIPDRDNGFADTLGYYGWKAGPYVYLPILGPTTLRDMAGAAGDYFSQPRVLGFVLHPSSKKSIFRRKLKLGKYSQIIAAVNGVDERARAEPALVALKKQSVDPYAALRSAYLQNREAEIAALKAKDGVPAQVPALDDPLEDPEAKAPKSPADAPDIPAPANPAAPDQTPHPAGATPD